MSFVIKGTEKEGDYAGKYVFGKEIKAFFIIRLKTYCNKQYQKNLFLISPDKADGTYFPSSH